MSVLLTACIIIGQTTIIEENFDGFTAGDKVVQTINNQSVWDTWSSSPGGSEDALISEKFANSTPNSLTLSNNNDIVLLFNDLTEGRYKFKFKVLIETGRIGYFNMLQDFAGGSSQWAFQTYFNANGAGLVDAGKTSAASFTYEYNTWMDANIVVDLDDDFATFYLDDVEIVSWKWSTGTSGAGTLKKLDAVNFYGNTTGGSSGMYVDDLSFSKETAPEAPSNLTATIQNDSEVYLSWVAPSSIPNNYVLLRNEEIINSSILGTEYTDIPYPGQGTYNVRAHTVGFGYSHGSNDVTIDIPGGIDRDFVLFEIGTGTGCVYCPGAAMGAVDMVENGDNVIIIKYHNFNSDDPFNTEASALRASNYYGITGYPTSFADGTLSIAGGSPTSSLFDGYHEHYLQRKAKKALYSIDLNVFHLSGNDYRAEITVEQYSGFNGEAKTMHTALTESDIDYSWFNQSQVHFSCRNMFPNASGTPLDFSAETSYSMDIDFSLEDNYVKDNCEFVVFLQADPSKEVMIATKVDLADILLNERITLAPKALMTYPNPVHDNIYLNQLVSAKYEILDLTGKQVQKGFAENRIDVSSLRQGIYFLQVEGFPVQKITIQ